MGNKFPVVAKGTTAWYNYGPGDSLYKNELKCRWTLHRRGALGQTNLDHWIDSNATLLSDAQARNFKEWPEWGWGDYISEPANPKNYTGEIDSLKGWMHRRMKWMDKYMPGTCRRDLNPPTVSLKWKDTVYLEVNTNYKDSGIVYHDNFGDTNVKVIIGNNLDTSTLGTYVYNYFLSDKAGNTATIQRVIVVIDTIAPSISFLNGDTVTTEVLETYKDTDVVITDNYDTGPLIFKSGNMKTLPDSLGYFYISYKAVDQSGNRDSAIKFIHVVDTYAPTIKINGKDTVLVEVYITYSDTDISIKDNYDKNPVLTHYGTLNKYKTDSLGIFNQWYVAADHSGNKDSIKRTIMVIDSIAPVIKKRGADSVLVFQDSTYTDAGYTATDNYDKKLKIDTSGTYLNSQMAGTFNISYQAIDQSGNKSGIVSRVITVLKDTSSGISQELNSSSAISIYPNPGNGKFLVSIKMQGNARASLEIYDALGRHLQGMDYTVQNGSSIVLHLEDKASGVYFLKLTSRDFTTSSRLLITQ